MVGKRPDWRPDEEELIRVLGARLRARREAIGLSQTEVAERVGMTQATLSKIENGANVGVHLVTVYRVASALYVPMHRLLPAPRSADRKWLLRLLRLRVGRHDADDDLALETLDEHGE